MRHANLDVGTQLGDFRIEGRLGAGGMGVVYRARQLSLDRMVALKLIDASAADPREIARFHRAAQAAARLQHPYIAAILAVGEEKGLCYLAMEQIEGASFQQVIQGLAAAPSGVRLRLPTVGDDSPDSHWIVSVDFHPLKGDIPAAAQSADSELPSLDLFSLALHSPPSRPVPAAFEEDSGEVRTTELPGAVGPGPELSLAAAIVLMHQSYHQLCCRWVRDAARGVQYAHDSGIIHRDLKPGNLMLGRDGRVRVIDFGLARCFDDHTLTATGQLLGTPLYMSPEQVTGRIELSTRTDVYSLGLVLYELLTLGPPITARDREELFQRIIAKPLEPLSEINPAVGAPLEAVAHMATAKDPEDRYESAGAFADDLERVLTGKPVAAPAYKPKVLEAELLNTRPTIIAVVSAQLLLGLFCWVAYGSFLFTMKDAPGRHRVPLPFVTLGWIGVALACLIGAGLGVAASWMSRGHRWGYWAGVGGQLALIASTIALCLTFNAIRLIEGDHMLTGAVISGFFYPVWLAMQLVQYSRVRVRSWFVSMQRLRQAHSQKNWFRGRPVVINNS
jgi:hypothetical protein